jgi:para-aminobenzoate synthetase / 4-amino-4-deoxychorismate lyase
MSIWIDHQLLGGTDVPRSKAFAPFETMSANNGQVPMWAAHMQRLAATAQRLGLDFEATPELRAAATEVMLANGHSNDVVRLCLVPNDDAAQPPIKVVKLLPTVVERDNHAPPPDIKAEPRSFYDAVVQQAQDGEADDGIVVGEDGALLETGLGNLWLRLAGVWCTPPLDGRVLPGIARAMLLAQADTSSRPISQRQLTLEDLHLAEAIAHSNAVYGPRPACLVGEQAAVAIVDSELGQLWRDATSS